MSTIRFKKDSEKNKKGELASVPFHRGRELIEAGIAEYANLPSNMKPPRPQPPKPETSVAGD